MKSNFMRPEFFEIHIRKGERERGGYYAVTQIRETKRKTRSGRRKREGTHFKQKEKKKKEGEEGKKGRQRALFLICSCPEKPQHKLQWTVSLLAKCLLARASL